ncbi:hsp20/alpha crystallin family domain-containing protein [Phthorimaea operculella]|nr:hsp20/alpha crystallin family domain-containing protein [Phthorimaea operculella]
MISPRFLAVLALVAAVAVAAPPTDSKPAGIPRPITIITEDDVDDAPWFSFPLFGNLFAPLWRLLPSFSEIGPKIVADDDKFQVIVNVKDYNKDDLKVKVKGDFIFVQGSHEAKHDDKDVFASQFFHTYTLPANSSANDVTAEISSDGYLIVTAPLNSPSDHTNETDREVPITESGKPYKEQTTTTQGGQETTAIQTEATTTTTALSQKDREPTTPGKDREEITENAEKDNDIRGNEITP